MLKLIMISTFFLVTLIGWEKAQANIISGNNQKHNTCHHCNPFGLFYQISPSKVIYTQQIIPFNFNTVAFKTNELALDQNSGSVVLKKAGFWLIHGSALVRHISNDPVPVDLFVTTNGGKNVIGSGRPTFIPDNEYKRLTTSVILKACDDCTDVSLSLLVPPSSGTQVYQELDDVDDTVVLDVIYLGPLDCVCQGCL